MDKENASTMGMIKQIYLLISKVHYIFADKWQIEKKKKNIT